jgi:Tfp pilus assembly protein FimT
MPTTSLGIRYPIGKDVITDLAYANLANDVDALLAALQVKRTAATHLNTARVRLTTPQNITAATATDLVYQVEDWDVGTLANLGVNNERLTIDNGIWFVTGQAQGSGTTTMTSSRAMLTLNGTVVYAHKTDQTSTQGTSQTVSGLVINNAGPSPLRLQNLWTGTGGPSSIIFASLTAIFIRPL